MKITFAVLINMIFLTVNVFAVGSECINFDDYFQQKTLRVDYFRLGDRQNEEIILDELIEEPTWGGNKVNLIDTLNFGNHLFKVFDIESNKLIYSRGYSSLFQEWQSTEEAKKYRKSFNETVIFPYPLKPVMVRFYSRDYYNNFKLIYEHEIDPSNYFIRKEQRYIYPKFKVHYSGDPNEKLDILILPEGYSGQEIDSFKVDCTRMKDYLFRFTPFSDYQNEINIWGIEAPSEESGADIPADSIWRKTLLDGSYYTFDSERYVMTENMRKVRDVAANAPYDQIYILVNSAKYGGGAIYNYYSMTAAKNLLSKKVFVHELAHGLAGLADEYGYDTTYQNYYKSDVEPWEPNITTLVDFESKWKYLLADTTPVPTPEDSVYYDVNGVFEGAGYVAKGVYRSTYDSIMRTLKKDEFNDVSREALIKVIEFYLK
jgi:hypothetical protein